MTDQPPATDDDEALMLRYRDGDAEAFDRLYARHRRRLYRFLLRQCGNAATADELFQDVWLRVIGARAGYTVQARFTTWLFRIAHHRLIDHWRGQAPAGATGDDGLDGIPAPASTDPARQAESREQARRLLDGLAALPSVQRETFLLHQETDMSLDEIALATGTGRETVRSRLRYALARLRLALAIPR